MITVIIPTYNRAAIIQSCLDSVLNQSYQYWECIVIDDFSDDKTKETIAVYSKRDNRIRYVLNQITKGAPGARNTGIDLAKGDFIVLLDSDDFLAPDCLQNQLTAHLTKNLDLVISLQRRVSDGIEGNIVNIPSKTDPLIRFFSLKPSCDIPWTNSIMIKRDFLISNKIRWNENISLFQDIQFNLEILSHKPRLIWIKSIDAYWTSNSKTASIGKDSSNNIEKHIKLLETYSTYYSKLNADHGFPIEGIRKQFKACIINIILMLASLNASRSQLKSVDKVCVDLLSLDTKISFWIYFKISKYKKYLFSRATLKLIRYYLNFRNSPIIKHGTFCLTDSLNTQHIKLFL